ncbi:hypothetical protein [Pararobbsia alpina]|uniref:Uncharacterized protein n=1 Tax=Pararobbsia alpina TaxID=621374 RepID=A0A6S7BDK0_9BURK|nr:hypothetical protein [Pararobbsia alpina]CAB3795866.1 hypothetical protein LMG28138_03961 [Pararobbsia alpina]
MLPQRAEPSNKGLHIGGRTVQQELPGVDFHCAQHHARTIRRDASNRFKQVSDSPAPHVQIPHACAAAAIALAQGIELIRASGTWLELDKPLTQHAHLACLARRHCNGAMAIDALIRERSATADRRGQHEFDEQAATRTPSLDLSIGKQVESAELRTDAGDAAMHEHTR